MMHTFIDGVEIWRDVPGYVGAYQVSDHGSVRSLDRLVTEKTGRIKFSRGRVLRPGPTQSGHLTVVLGRRHTKLVHALVLLAFEGPYPTSMEILHGDHNPSNNKYSNLKYGTRRENILADYAVWDRSWAKAVVATLSDGRREYFRSVTAAAAHFSVSQPTVSMALINKTALRKTKVRFGYVA